MQRAIWIGLVVVLLAGDALAQSGGERGKQVTFEAAVERLVSAIRKASPEGVTCQVATTTPKALGWKAAKKAAARTLTIWTPSGGAVAFGVIPRRGTLEPIAARWPRLVAVGKHVVVVGGPQPEVSMTFEAMEAAQQLLREASAPITKAAEGEEVRPKHRPAGLANVKKVTKYLHYVAIDLAPGQTLDEASVRAMGYSAVAYRVVPDKGRPPPHTVKILAKPKAP